MRKIILGPVVLYAIWLMMAVHRFIVLPSIPEGMRFSEMWFFEGMLATYVVVVIAGYVASMLALLSGSEK